MKTEHSISRKTGLGRQLGGIVAVLALLLPAGAAWAQWQLDAAQSALDIVSIKNNSVAEVHHFTSLQGAIGADGGVRLGIDLASLETQVPIRNERMRELLFDTAKFPAATVTATVDPQLLATAIADGATTTELSLTLSLHGVDKAMTAPVVVVADTGGDLRVFTPQPIIINAADFGLEAGVSALQAIAGLKSISTAVPVNVYLVFSRAD